LRSWIIAFFVFLVLFSTFFGTHQVEAQSNQPTQLTEANGAVTEAFVAVLEAEQAGANVTVLLGRLNDATSLLAQAEIAYRAGNTNTATEQVKDVSAIASEVETNAVTAKNDAAVKRQDDFWLMMGISEFAAFSFVALMFLLWIRFKRNYIKKASQAKEGEWR
jgi:hypothetical protein